MKNRLVQAAAVLAGALAPWMAGADTLAARLVTEQPSVVILKAPGDPLRFRWAARVGASGQFVLTGPDGTEVWTAAVVGRKAYEASPPALSGEYELRYRDASGREHVLAHVLVACARVEHHAPMTMCGRPIAPNVNVSGSQVGSAEVPTRAVNHPSRAATSPLLRPPPTPPPRSWV
jgi:hypothetical protein